MAAALKRLAHRENIAQSSATANNLAAIATPEQLINKVGLAMVGPVAQQ